MSAPSSQRRMLRLAVVGHTNTGKTSLLRTLMRDPNFGTVKDAPGATRQVEGARLLVNGQPLMELLDTPGLEDGMAALDYLEQLTVPGERLDGPDRIQRLLNAPESTRRFEQESRVLRALTDCDAGLYVVDVRDPVLAKHKDELALLAACGKPLLPVLNFIHSAGHRADAWRDTLSRLGLHAIVEFDTVAPALDGEAQLYAKLALLLDTQADLLGRIRDDIVHQRSIRYNDAMRLVAELLIDVAALRIASKPDEAAVKQATEHLRQLARDRESVCVKALLARYNFRPSDYPTFHLPLQGERWGMDLFHPQALKDMGLQVGKGMAAGAMAGVTVDIFTAGLSLGAAALIGAAAGGLWQGAEKFGKRIAGRLQGFQELAVDDPVLRLLALRQLALIEALQRRGHAAQGPIVIDEEMDEENAGDNGDNAQAAGPRHNSWRKGQLPRGLSEARSQPQWSTLTDHYEGSRRRDEVVNLLVQQLKEHASSEPTNGA